MKPSSDDSPNTSKNISDPIREYKVWELQKQTDDLLAAIFPSGYIIPIEIENVAYHLGLDINPIPGLHKACQVLGALWRDGTSAYWIVIDEHMMDHQEARYRFTVAEEIAHFVLHKSQITKASDIRAAIALQERLAANYSYFEANARRFAAELLMPRKPLQEDTAEAYSRVVGVVGFRNLAAVTKQVTDMLRRKYVVSFQAMEHQLNSYQLKVPEAIGKAFRARSEVLWPGQ